MPDLESTVTEETLKWIHTFILKYSICPFAKKPVNNNQLRVCVSATTKKEQALEALMTEILALDEDASIETTLLVFSQGFRDFFAYLDLVTLAERLLSELEYEGIYQIVSFHPEYYFADSEPDDAANYTNRSPYPMIHILREESLDRAIKAYGDTSKIPEQNIVTMEQLGVVELKKILNNCYN